MRGGSYMVTLFKQEVVSHKISLTAYVATLMKNVVSNKKVVQMFLFALHKKIRTRNYD